ncbi:MAG: hypothetical protein QOJ13_1470 [Gaiellales bacterium]|nr:hypothetical protein [Gaiellales bacterium]
MSAYIVSTFTITNGEEYSKYAELVVPTVLAYGGELLVADHDSDATEGDPEPVTIIIRFESKAAAHAWYESHDYSQVRHLRDESVEGTTVIVDGFVIPE